MMNTSEPTSHGDDDMGILDVNCWSFWPLWECYAANVAGLISTGLWFIVLLPQVIKNFYRRSVSGLSFLWAVANFTASLVNLFFAFSIELPLYVRVSAVYMPVLELTILGQFMLYSKKVVTTRLLVLLVCLVMWGGIIELELNLPESRDKIQWIAITLWSIETFPQVILNMKLQSTEGQSTISVIITIFGKTTDFLVTYGLNMPLPYVVMCYYSSTSAFINGFQVVWYGRDSWFSRKTPPDKDNLDSADTAATNEHTKLLRDKMSDVTREQNINTVPSNIPSPHSNTESNRTFRYYCVSVARFVSISYIICGLLVFAVGFFLRTATFVAILGPLSCLLVVMTANEYYRLQRTDINFRRRTLCCV